MTRSTDAHTDLLGLLLTNFSIAFEDINYIYPSLGHLCGN